VLSAIARAREPCDQIIAAFDAVRVEMWGAEAARSCPSGKDVETANAWLRKAEKAGVGATDAVPLFSFEILTVQEKVHRKGHRPPDLLSYHSRDIDDLLKNAGEDLLKVALSSRQILLTYPACACIKWAGTNQTPGFDG
jgi:hypothetical protein